MGSEPHWDPSLRPFPRAERLLGGRAETDLPALTLADRVSDTLGLVLEKIDLPRKQDEGDDRWYQTQAVLYLGLLAGRSLRAMMALYRLGYEAEALVFKRRLSEVNARVNRVVDEQHGAERARNWLEGRDRKPSSVVEVPRELWDGLSHVAHADFRAVEQHLVAPRADGLSNFALLPIRATEKANASLALAAAETRDLTLAIASFRRLRINGIEALDAALEDAADRYIRNGE